VKMETKTFLRIHLGIQMYLVLVGIGSGLVAKFLFDMTQMQNFEPSYCIQSGKNGSEVDRVPVIVTAMFYSVASYGIIQTGTAILYIGVYLTFGFIIKRDLLLITCFTIVLEILNALIALVFSGIVHWYCYQAVLHCEQTSVMTKQMVYGLPIFIIGLSFAIVVQIYLCSVFRTVEFFIVVKNPETPPRVRVELAHSPAIYINRAELKGVNDAYELFHLQNMLRTRLPSLKSQPQLTQVSEAAGIQALKTMPTIPHRGLDISRESMD